MPYDLDDLNQLIDKVRSNPKVSIHTIGSAYMGRPIPIIRVRSVQNSNIDKKVIVVMGRQHPGETVGSYIGHEMLE